MLLGFLLLADVYLEMASRRFDRALEGVQALVKRASQAEVYFYLPEALWLQGKIWMALGEPVAARPLLLKAWAVAGGTGARRVLWQILWELSRLAMAVGYTTEARQYRQQAQEIVTYIVDHAGSDELRASFLALPEVQALGDG